MVRCRDLKDVYDTYGKDNVITICNIKQVVQYAKMGCQPVLIQEGYDGKFIAYYFKPETATAWEHWKKHKSQTND